MRICLILNPNAGSAQRCEFVLRERQGQDDLEIFYTEQQGHARHFAARAVEEGYERIIAAGGDGTINEALNGIAPNFERVELAIVPAGTGNDLVRSLGIPSDDVDAALALALTGPSVPLDVVRFSNGRRHYFLNVAAGGVGGEQSAMVEKQTKERWGSLAYLGAAASAISGLEEYDVRLELDGQPLSTRVYAMAIANGRYIGGGVRVAPQAMLNDGMVDVIVVPVQPLASAALAAMKVLLGQQDDVNGILALRASTIRMDAEPDMPFNVDGELVGRVDPVVEVLPRALRVVVGPEAEALTEAQER